MAFPSIRSSTTSNSGGNTTSHTVSYPATVTSGDQLLCIFCVDGASSLFTPTGWTLLRSVDDNSTYRVSLYGKIADGTEGGGTFTVTSTNSEESSHCVLSIQDQDATLTASSTAAANFATTTTSIDPPNVTPPQGTRDYLWIACGGSDGPRTATGGPTNYTTLTSVQSGGGGGVAAFWAERQLNAASENPSTFTLNNADTGGAFTVGVAGAASGTQTDKTLTYSGVGTSGTPVKEVGLNRSFSGIGTSVLSRVTSFFRTLTYSGVGTSTIAKAIELTKAYSGVGTAVLAASKLKLQNLVYSAVGTSVLSTNTSFGKALAYTATGTNALLKRIAKSLSFSGNGTQVLSRTLSYLRTINFSGIGTSSLAKDMAISFSIGAQGTAALGAIKTKLLSLVHSASGTANLTRSMLIQRAMSAIGTSTVLKHISKFVSYSGTGTSAVSTAATLLRTITVSGIGTCVTLAETGLQHLASMSGTGSLSLRKRVGIFRAYVGTGVVAGTKIIEKLLGITVLGTPAEQESSTVNESNSAAGTGTPASAQVFQAGGGPPGLIIRRFIRAVLLSVNRWF